MGNSPDAARTIERCVMPFPSENTSKSIKLVMQGEALSGEEINERYYLRY